MVLVLRDKISHQVAGDATCGGWRRWKNACLLMRLEI
jgi:hypothetical protein